MELVVQLLHLRLLLGPWPRRIRLVDQIYILVVFAEIVDRVLCQLECHLVGQHQVDVHDVGLDVQQLEPGESLDQRVVVPVELRRRGFGHHQSAEIPDRGRLGERLGKTFHVLRDAVQRSLDAIDALESRRQPRIDLGV